MVSIKDTTSYKASYKIIHIPNIVPKKKYTLQYFKEKIVRVIKKEKHLISRLVIGKNILFNCPKK